MLIKPKPKKFYSYAPTWGKAAGGGGGGGGGASFTPLSAMNDSQDFAFGSSNYTSPTITFTNGIALVFISLGAARVPNITSFTIKGVTATQYAPATEGNYSAVYYAPVTAGTGTVQIANSFAYGQVVICGGMITGGASAPSAGGFKANGFNNTPNDTVASPITIPTNGVGVVVGMDLSVSNEPLAFPMIWTGATRIAAMENTGAGGSVAGASSSTPGSFAPTFLSQSPSGGGNPYWSYTAPGGMAVTWGP